LAERNATDAEWVEAALERYEGPLLRYAARMLGDLESAQDVVQDTFLRLCKANRSRMEDHLAQWLFTVCRNRALDILRKEQRMTPATAAQVAAQATPPASPAASAQREEVHGHVVEALGALPEKHQEVIRLKFQERLSYREISEITGNSVSNVGYLIHTGLKRIRAELDAVGRLEQEVSP